MSPQMQQLLAEMNARDNPPPRPAEKEDPIIAEIKAAAPFLDEGFRSGKGKGWPPSAMIMIGYCAVVTSRHAGAKGRADEFANGWLDLARLRWKGGYRANPFGDPVVRDGSAG